ncbi:methylmalonyl-CoA mutase family protein [Candidatus Marinimicrobia bacterium]|nr:methylmalonyl-CoA mutase family protein [Candidatus Neomarinimicrobiota bacterium]|tara:strand:+ start:1450 stop:3048 length:1599 start_codon:yes stop_codon:yes gene_type:complete
MSKKNNRRFETLSGKKNKTFYYPKSKDSNYKNKLNDPGDYPYTRGIHGNMYRGKLWTMRQFAGFGKPQETNKRFKFLLKQGQTGLSVAFDMPTLMGYDPDHDFSLGEVGHCGVSISNLKDMECLFDGIDLTKVSVSMTINGPAVVIFAFYVALAIKRKNDLSLLNGTLQNDILKEYIAQKEWIYPPKESMRIITDMVSYCKDNLPNYNTISISGYHIREAGSTAQQELAFTLANGFTYVEHCIKAGLDVDDFAPRLSFFFNAHSDFFEEIAKYRAARKIWSNIMKNKYKAKNPKSLKLRFHTQTAGCSLTAQQPENNITRTSFQALSAVLGGTQSLHTNSMDETLALPSEKAAEIALRTQQVLAHETGVSNVADPLGGSWYVEELTQKMEEDVLSYFDKIKDLGGVINCIESGFLQKEIADSSADLNEKIDNNERVIVGMNDYINEDEKITIPILKISKKVENIQVDLLKKLRLSRNNDLVKSKLDNIEKASRSDKNLLNPIIDAVLEYATLGEIVESMKNVFGEWQEKSVI